MPTSAGPRIAVLGFDLEANRFAPPCGRKDFLEKAWYKGEEISRAARAPNPSIHAGLCGFYQAMDAAGPWVPVPVLQAGAQPNGPVEQGFFEEILAEFRAGLAAALPVDGVYVCEHGGAIATGDHDPDGTVFALVREIVGPDTPVIATLDLHCNISERMLRATDVMIAYRTNPHVDGYERGQEAAAAMREMLAGLRPKATMIRLPLVAPSTTQLTAEGHPYGDLIRLGQTKVGPDILNVSAVSGFAFADTPKNGMTIIVTARHDRAKARQVARELAIAAWADHERYRPRFTPLAEAVERVVRAGRDATVPSLLLADPADNPGGGGRGNTTYILKALHEAGAEGVLLGVFFDPALVEEAFARGEGAVFTARFNRAETEAFSQPFAAEALVERLTDGTFVGSHGMVAGRTVRLGRSALLRVGGIRVAVITLRQQCLSADYFAHFGAEVAAARATVVKSRGHFRAGFQHLFPPERILEVDVPGLTSPNLANFAWKHLPRPVYPLDPETRWEPPAD